MNIYLYICIKVAIYHYMDNPSYITNQDIISLLCRRLKEYRLAARISQREIQNITLGNFISLLRVVGQEQRLLELLPELPMPPMALKQINKLIPKRVRRNSDDTKS